MRSKLKAAHVVAIGLALCLVFSAAIFFLLIKPAQATGAGLESSLSGFQSKASQEQAAKRQLITAKQQQAQTLAQYAAFKDRYFRVAPERQFISMSDPNKAMILLWKEQANTLGPLLRRSIQKAGVKLTSAITIPAPPTDPNQVPADIITIPVTGVTVVGSFPKINAFLRGFAKFSRLVEVNNVTLSGESPNMQAQMDMTVIILPDDTNKHPTVPTATDQSTGGGGGGYSYPGANPYPTPMPGGAGNAPAGNAPAGNTPAT